MTFEDLQIADQLIWDHQTGELIYVKAQWPAEAKEYKEEGRIRVSLHHLMELLKTIDQPGLIPQIRGLQSLADRTRESWGNFIVDLQRAAERHEFKVHPDFETGTLVVEASK